MEPISLSVFFPAYNEEENIAEAVMSAVRVLRDSPFVRESEVIVVNDGSTDSTQQIVEDLQREHPTVRLITHTPNKGYGASLRTGLDSARMDYVFFTDSDLQFDTLELQNLLTHVGQNDVVIGYRAPRRDPFMRLVNAWGWKQLNRLLFGLKVRDIDCAFKLFKRDVVQSLRLTSSGAMLSAELLIRLQRKQVTIKEVPVSHLPRTRGSATGAKISVIMRALVEMFSLYRGELGLGTHKELFRFASVGVINTALDALLYIGLTRGTVYFAEHVTEAKLLSFLLGTVSSLVLNRLWTFKIKTAPRFSEVVRFYTTAGLSLLINVGMMNFLVSAGMYDLIALGITTIVTFVGSFTLTRSWVYGTSRSRELNPYRSTTGEYGRA
jgi:glycosyltransferase involved in cell wall biosynthesis